MSENFIRENWQLIAIIYVLFFVFLIYKVLFAHRNKILVRIKTPSGREIRKWCKLSEDGETVIVKKPTRKKAGWSFKINNRNLLHTYSWGRRYDVVDVFYDAPQAIEYDFTNEKINAPKLTKDQVKEFGFWEGLRARYSRIQERKSSIQYVILAATIVNIVLTIFLLLTGGKVHFG